MGECAEVLIEIWGDNTYTPGSAPAPSAGAVPSSSRQPPPPSTSVLTPVVQQNSGAVIARMGDLRSSWEEISFKKYDRDYGDSCHPPTDPP